MPVEPTLQVAAPVNPDNRHAIIDIVRGFALYGVLLANLIWVALWCGTPSELLETLPTHELDEIVDLLVLVFVDSKFYTLFSMLFGLGLAIQLNSAKRRGGSITPTYLRRLGILFVIGALHTTLIWFGDVLHMYAITGVILLGLSRFSVKALLRIALVLAILTSLLPALAWQLDLGGKEAELSAAISTEHDDPLYLAMRNGSYSDVVDTQVAYLIAGYTNGAIAGDESMLTWYLNVLWKFLLGFCIGRMGILQNLTKHRAAIRRLFPWALAVGLAGNGLCLAFVAVYDVWIPSASSWVSLLNLPYQLGILALSVAYACWLCLLVTRPTCPGWISALAPVGRMALTNYLMHSLFYVAIFYQLGFGAIGKIGATSCLTISLAIFMFQIAFSRWWLNRYRFGPAEWAWRSLTYGSLQRMRIES